MTFIATEALQDSSEGFSSSSFGCDVLGADSSSSTEGFDTEQPMRHKLRQRHSIHLISWKQICHTMMLSQPVSLR